MPVLHLGVAIVISHQVSVTLKIHSAQARASARCDGASARPNCDYAARAVGGANYHVAIALVLHDNSMKRGKRRSVGDEGQEVSFI